MVDREARRQFAELVRQFVSGRMTADQYNEQSWAARFHKKDPAMTEVWDRLDSLCEDALPDRMTEAWRLGPDARREAAQAVLFLQTSEEYRWQEELWDGSVFLITAFLVVLLFALLPETALIVRTGVAAVLVSGWLGYEQWQARRQERRRTGDTDAWPFWHQVDLDEAVRHPRLLNGGR